jgi:hypothetical protein
MINEKVIDQKGFRLLAKLIPVTIVKLAWLMTQRKRSAVFPSV